MQERKQAGRSACRERAMTVGVFGSDGRVRRAVVLREPGVPVSGVQSAHQALLVSAGRVGLGQDVGAESVTGVRVSCGRSGQE